MRRRRELAAGLLLHLLILPGAASGQAEVALSGTLIITGSDTLAELVTVWADGFVQANPGVKIELQGAGSGSAPPALAQGTANIGSMSRPMSNDELERFDAARGFLPTAVPVAIDTIAIIVHPDNPLLALSGSEIDGIFSATQSCRAGGRLREWQHLGLTGPWVGRRIEAYGRTAVSGTHGFFKSRALCGGDFHARVNEMPGSAAIVDAVATRPTAIGYTGLGVVDSRVRVLALRGESGQTVRPEPAATRSGAYPLSRLLYFYLAVPPGEAIPVLECAFLAFARSEAGRAMLTTRGFLPVPTRVLPSPQRAVDRACY